MVEGMNTRIRRKLAGMRRDAELLRHEASVRKLELVGQAADRANELQAALTRVRDELATALQWAGLDRTEKVT